MQLEVENGFHFFVRLAARFHGVFNIVISDSDAFDILNVSLRSKAFQAFFVQETFFVRQLLGEPRDLRHFCRLLLVLCFICRRSSALLDVLASQLVSGRFGEFDTVGRVFDCLKLARFPAHPALYRLADSGNLSHSIAAAWCNDIVKLEDLQQRGMLEPNARLKSKTPVVSLSSDPACVRFLLEHRAGLYKNWLEDDFASPLYCAARLGNVAAVRELVAAGAEAGVDTATLTFISASSWRSGRSKSLGLSRAFLTCSGR